MIVSLMDVASKYINSSSYFLIKCFFFVSFEHVRIQSTYENKILQRDPVQHNFNIRKFLLHLCANGKSTVVLESLLNLLVENV